MCMKLDAIRRRLRHGFVLHTPNSQDAALICLLFAIIFAGWTCVPWMSEYAFLILSRHAPASHEILQKLYLQDTCLHTTQVSSLKMILWPVGVVIWGPSRPLQLIT